MTILVDEWTAFMHAFDDELVGGLTTFYDVTVPYEHHRRGKDIRIRILRPQLSVLAGSTPSNLIKFMPEFAWEQGFTSRVIMVYSGERFIGDDFAVTRRDLPDEMIHDLKVIYALQGEFKVSEEFRQAVSKWRQGNEEPRPTHPKLLHYNTRRRAHVYKLSMVSAVNRGNSLILGIDDFNTALGWLSEAEATMPLIFEEGASHIDGKVMDEVADFVARQGKPVPKHQVIRYTSSRVPAHTVLKLLDVMIHGGRVILDPESGTFTCPSR